MRQNHDDNSLFRISNIIGIAAGKGGVGKSTMTVNMALALVEMGYRVGILDADIYGPSIAKMLGIENPITENSGRMIPARSKGISYVSMSFFEKSFKSTVLRAPLVNQVIEEFIQKVDWGELDFLLVDFPPGTGDIQITLLQQIPFTLGVAVSTPQQVALLDVKKAIDMFIQMNVEVMGIVQNMSYFLHQGVKITPFGEGLTDALAKELGIGFLGEIPIDPLISHACDHGLSLFDSESDSKKSYLDLATDLINFISNSRKKKNFDVEWHLNRKAFVLTFPDGTSIVSRAHKVQKTCLCVRCQMKPPQIGEEVAIMDLIPIGNYGVKFIFSEGCSRGIYPFARLKKI